MSTPYDEIFSGINVEDIIDRCVKSSNSDTPSGLARSLGLSKSSLSQMKKRNTVPFEVCVIVSIRHRVDLNYLLFGEGIRSDIDKEKFLYNFKETVLTGIQMEIISETDDTDDDSLNSLGKSLYNKVITPTSSVIKNRFNSN